MERSKDTYSYGCAMLYFSFTEMTEMHLVIDRDDLYTEEEDRTYGLIEEPHVTLLYGLHSEEINDYEIINICTQGKIGDIRLYNVSLFENKNYDVLKFDAHNKVLYQINRNLVENFPFTTEYPNYHPHSTIAYIKSGRGKKYAEMLKDKEFIATPDKIVYSKSNGTKIENTIG